MPVETSLQWDEVREQCRNIVKLEFANYLNNPSPLAHNQCPLGWWRDNRHLYPNLARTAQKWLCVCATSAPSEHFFSNCGVALTAKRSKLNGSCLKSQILFKNNMKGLTLTVDDIINTL
jgi:hAT family C-terminal dimerisation region